MSQTESKRDNLRKSLWEFILDRSPEAIYVLAPDGGIVDANQGCSDMLGYSRKELLAMTVFDIHAGFSWKDWTRRWKTLKERGTGVVETEHRTKEGDLVSVEVMGNYFTSNGKEFNCAFAREITGRKKAETKIRSHAERLAALHEASEALVTSLEFSPVADKCARIAKDLLKADGAVIFLKKPRGKYLEPIVSRGSYGSEVLSMRLRLGEGVSGRVAVSGKSEIINRVDLTDNGKQVPGTPVEPESLLSAPLKVKTKVTGVITLDRLGERKFSEDDLSFLEDLANICAAAIENARAYDQARKEIEDRKQAQENLKRSEEELHRLTAHLQKAREQERIEIARKLQDNLGQAIADVKRHLESLKKEFPRRGKLVQKINASLKTMDDSSQTLLGISRELRPVELEEVGLTEAIKSQTEQFQDRSGVLCKLTTDSRLDSLDADRCSDIFWVVQEALSNVARHANATSVEVDLKREKGDLRLSVKDDGKGISEEELWDPTASGILAMRQRMYPWGGRFRIHGRKGKGTRVEVILPLE
ncbi:MAG: PAS domain S-box protein [Fidelibacterota bacterium]